MPEFGFGITNICARATPGIDTLLPEEYVVGRVKLRRKILRYKPKVVAMVGVTVFRAMFPERKGAVKLGLQPEKIGDTAVFVLPNPSGRNANFTYAEMLAAFRALRRATHHDAADGSVLSAFRWLARDQACDVAAFGQGTRSGRALPMKQPGITNIVWLPVALGNVAESWSGSSAPRRVTNPPGTKRASNTTGL